MSEDPYINHLIFQKYLVKKRIGKGSFGTVYSGIITQTHEKIAIKFEKREKNKNGTLETEAYRLIYLQGPYIPKIICYGNNHTHNILVQELLGSSLENLFNLCHKKFSLKTVCVLGIEMIKRIKYIHNKHHIHRDIKPDNFMTGRDDKENKIYLIDFGLAKKYFSTSKKTHIKFTTGKSLTGTARYCARNAHKGFEQSRRDDIESIGYVLIYFLNGNLPWQGLKIKEGEDQFKKIAEKKCNTSFEELTKNTHEEFLLYFKHVDSLEFEDQPDYDYLIGLFQSMIDKYCNDCFYDFDWKKNVIEHFSSGQGKNIKKNNSNNSNGNNNGNVSFISNNNKSKDVSLFVCKNNESKIEKDDRSNDDNDIKKDNNLFIKEDNDDDNFKINSGKHLKKMRSNSSVNIKGNLKYNDNFFDKENNDKNKKNQNNNNFVNNEITDLQNINNNHNINVLATSRKYNEGNKKDKIKNKKNKNIEISDINVEVSKEKGNEETRITDNINNNNNNNNNPINNINYKNNNQKNNFNDKNKNNQTNKKKKRHNSMTEIEIKDDIKCCKIF